MEYEYISAGGDSGGGMFRSTKKGVELVGIGPKEFLSSQMFFTYGYYGQVAEWRRVAVYYSWIRKMMGNDKS